MAKAGQLPGRQTLLDVVKSVNVPDTYSRSHETGESRELRRKANALRSKLLKNKELASLEKRADQIEENRKRQQEALRKRKRDLIVKVKLAMIDEQLVREVRAFAGIK